MNAALLTLLVGIVCTGLFVRSRSKTRHLPLPPGPKPLPLVGNVLDIPLKQMWLAATGWAKQYGDVVYVHVFGVALVFLNTTDAAFDLMEKRGAIYSDKPRLVMTGELCGCESMVAFTRYGDKMRRYRRLFQRAFGPASIKTYFPLLEMESAPFLRRLITTPTRYNEHIRRYAGSLVLNVVYGYQVTSNNDPNLGLAEECVDLLANRIASGGGIWPVDVMPFLQYMPDWMPGSGFLRNARIWKAKMQEFVDKPYEYVKDQMAKGTAVPSFCSTLLEQDGKSVDEQAENDIKWAANSMYSAAGDTTIAAISHFILAMVQHPEVLLKAQQEIDTVIGRDRLPSCNDRPNLPYVEAILHECLRWGVPVPLGLPHRLMEDDVYRDMYIPQGALVFANIWAMLRDEKLYPNPDAFYPERFLEKVDEVTERKRDPRNYVFGFGRRRCPGNHLADASTWLLIACMCATLDISKAVDDHGNVIEPDVKFENSVFRGPSPFVCDIRPRSEQALRLISQDATE
ncbi:cytochrome P450 [Heliocybe sulcata]|uniref:Cytochrome P450 n=1 Tax=Heliocybe sulcata TaxID=5364 RepID=A0A5C3MZ87_9AGAM|nr:cytochrome P450 [Heliocybe sulcata]